VAFEAIRLSRPAACQAFAISVSEVADERGRLFSELIRGRDYRLSRRHGLQGA
jgi:hypothetical protein